MSFFKYIRFLQNPNKTKAKASTPGPGIRLGDYCQNKQNIIKIIYQNNMKKLTFSLISIALLASTFFVNDCAAQSKETAPKKIANSDTSKLAIDFQAINLKGQPFHANSLKGKTVLLDFWAVWCAPCIAAFPTLKKLNQDLKKDNFEVVGVAVYSGTYKDVRLFVAKHNLDYKIVVGDDDMVERFGVIGYPTYFLIGPDGKIHKKYVGEAKNLYSEVKKDVLGLQQNRRSK